MYCNITAFVAEAHRDDLLRAAARERRVGERPSRLRAVLGLRRRNRRAFAVLAKPASGSSQRAA